nr:hypothetical protein [uncultured Agrobacterium sp.]
MQKAGPSTADRRPWRTIAIDRADDDERQQRIELPVLVKQEGSQDPAPHWVHLLDHTGVPLYFKFARMPW